MKHFLTIIFFFIVNFSDAQLLHFQRQFNLNYTTPSYRHERFNSGLRTVYNFSSCTNVTQYFLSGIGTSYNNTALASPHNVADRLRFTRTDASGNVLNNLGHEYLGTDGKKFHSHGNSIAEIKNSACNGGYFAIGDVINNSITGALTTGGSDVLLTRLNASGGVVNASRLDINGGRDVGWCIRRSNIVSSSGLPTFIICGESRNVNNAFTDCFVARIDINGTILWCRRYNFDPTNQFTSAHCIAKQLCEDPQGNIYVVGTVQDNPLGATGIDGLAFKLTSAGNIVWANRYNIASNDAFQAVRFTADNNLIVGGNTNYTNVTNTLITKLTSAAGAVIFRYILRTISNNTVLPSSAYDIIEVPSGQGPQYYLGGVLVNAGLYYEMMYRTGSNGVGISWSSYNRKLYSFGVGLDYAKGTCPGIAYFSSLRNPLNISDGHIMKTDLTTRTCGFFPRSPNTILPPIGVAGVPRFLAQTGIRTAIRWLSFTYGNKFICSTACSTPGTGTEIVNSSERLQEKNLTAPTAKEGSLKIAPNPAINSLRMQFQSLPDGEYEVSLMNIDGKLMLRKKIFNKGSSMAEIDISRFAPGIYILNASRGNVVLQQKVVKQ